MNKFLSIIITSTLLPIMFISCNRKKAFIEYEVLKAVSIKENNLFETLIDYDIKHQNTFESKVDIASLYILSENWPKAEEYLKRAEIASKNYYSKEYLCNYYGLKATIYLKNKKFDDSLLWCKKAYSIKEFGSKYYFLEGQIYFAKDDINNSLQSFKKAFTNNEKDANVEDIKLYTILLAEKEEYKESLKYLNKLFENGFYYYGLGQFASSIYEKNEMLFEAVLCAFLDYDYMSNFAQTNENQFLINLNKLRTKFIDNEKFAEIEKAINCINSIIRKDKIFPENINSSFFVYQFLKLRHSIINKNKKLEDFESILKFKKYFQLFPVYHYLVAECFFNLEIEGYPSECFENIINISSNNKYSNYARSKIGEFIGLTKEESLYIMTFFEIENLERNIANNRAENDIVKLCNLLSLPDNKYVFYAQDYFKSNINKNEIKKVLKEEFATSKGRIKERLNYILFQ